MMRNLAVVISGGALVLGLAATAGPLGTSGASATTAVVASGHGNDPPIIDDSSADGTQAAPAYGLPPPVVDD